MLLLFAKEQDMYNHKKRAMLHLVTEAVETEVIEELKTEGVETVADELGAAQDAAGISEVAVLPVCKDGVCMVTWKPTRQADKRIAS